MWGNAAQISSRTRKYLKNVSEWSYAIAVQWDIKNCGIAEAYSATAVFMLGGKGGGGGGASLLIKVQRAQCKLSHVAGENSIGG